MMTWYTFLVAYRYESPNTGYSHSESTTVRVKAATPKTAINKAKREVKKNNPYIEYFISITEDTSDTPKPGPAMAALIRSRAEEAGISPHDLVELNPIAELRQKDLNPRLTRGVHPHSARASHLNGVLEMVNHLNDLQGSLNGTYNCRHMVGDLLLAKLNMLRLKPRANPNFSLISKGST